jgi:hypothetical protein
MLSVCPTQKLCGVSIRDDHNEKNKCISYFKKFEKINIRLKNPSSEEVQKIKNECETKCNKITDVFNIKKEELDEFIIKNFRYVEPIRHFDYKLVPIPPYILGLWLGDGHSAGPSLTNIDIPIIEAWCEYGTSLGLQIREDNQKDRITEIQSHEKEQVVTYHITSGKQNNNIVRQHLQKLNLINNKHIPDIYLYNSENVRCAVLAGLLDTDGSLSKGRYEITQKNEKLSNNIVTLCKSLGFHTRMVEKWNSCTNSKNPNHIDKYYRISISINQFSPKIPILCERKKFNHENTNFWFNPKLDLDGTIILANEGNTEWTEDLNLVLYSVVETFKKKEPNQIIPWARLHEFDDRLSNIKVEGLRSQYEKKLKGKEYEILQLDFNVIEDEWMVQYEKVKKSFVNRKPVENQSWYQSQKHYENLYISKKELLLELEKLKPKSNRNSLREDLEYIKSEILVNKNFEKVILLKNGKLILPVDTTYHSIGTTVSQLKSELKKDTIFWNGMIREEILQCFGDILDEYHLGLADNRTDMIIQFDSVGKTQIFSSCLDAAKYMVEKKLIKSFKNGKIQISKACKTGKEQYGYKWVKWIEYNIKKFE